MWPDAGNLAEIEYLAFMRPDFDSLPVFPNLEAMFAMAAVAPPHDRRSQRSGSAPLRRPQGPEFHHHGRWAELAGSRAA